MLLEHPAAGALTDEPDTRRAVVNPYPYAIFYQVREDTLYRRAHPPHSAPSGWRDLKGTNVASPDTAA